MIYEKLELLCAANKTSVTALCKEITGSSGNLPTWQKDNIKASAIIAICKKFKISSDSLLGIPKFEKPEETGDEVHELFDLIRALPQEQRWELKGYVKRMVQEQSVVPRFPPVAAGETLL